jgi:hypothetical protein
MALCISFPHWEFVSELPGRGFFEGLSQDEGQADFSETSALLSLIKTFQLNIISAGSILLDSTFNNFYKACIYFKKCTRGSLDL